MMSRRLRIHGTVQGVGYRYALRREALRLGLTGWVRNRLDGSVEALVQGGQHQMDAVIEWAHAGPPTARVAGVEVEPADEPARTGFELRPTG